MALEFCSGFVYKQLEKQGFNVLYALKNRSSTDAALRASYMKLLKNDDINWKKAVICSQHWSKGKRENLYDLPDRVCNEQYVQNLEKSASKCAKLKAKKLVAAKRSLEFSSREVKSKRRIIVKKERRIRR